MTHLNMTDIRYTNTPHVLSRVTTTSAIVVILFTMMADARCRRSPLVLDKIAQLTDGDPQHAPALAVLCWQWSPVPFLAVLSASACPRLIPWCTLTREPAVQMTVPCSRTVLCLTNPQPELRESKEA